MKVKLVKVGQEQWDVLVNGEVVGKAGLSYMHHGSYLVKMNDGGRITAFNQKGIKSMVERYLGGE